jgi:hypothetical protein
MKYHMTAGNRNKRKYFDFRQSLIKALYLKRVLELFLPLALSGDISGVSIK